MLKTKKFLSLLLAVLMLSTVLAGCVSDPASPVSEDPSSTASGGDETINLTFWTLMGRASAFDELTKEFEAANPNIKITVSYYDTDPIKDALKVAASSKSLPDMWFMWGGSLGGFYAENNLTYDLTAYADAHGWADTFSPGVMSLCTLSGKLSGYPTGYNVISMYYRKDIFEQNGLSIPNTLEEFEQVCDALKAKGIVPVSTAGMYGWHIMRIVEQLIEHYAGPQLHDSMNAFTESYNNEAVVKALTKYQEYCQKGYFPEGFVTADPADTKMTFYTGAAAMIPEGQWYDGVIIQDEQDISKYGVFAFPSGDKRRLSAFGEMTQFNANLTEAQVDAGVKYMNFLYSQTSLDRFGEYYSRPLPRLDAVMPDGQPNVPVALDISNKNGTFTITDQAFPTEIADALFNVQDGIANGQITPADGAAQIQAAIEAYRK